MPWTAKQFKTKHWKDATPAQAAKAAKMATAMIEDGTPDSVAIPTAIKRAKSTSKKGGR